MSDSDIYTDATSTPEPPPIRQKHALKKNLTGTPVRHADTPPKAKLMRLHPILHTPPPSSPNLPSERKRKTTEDQPHMREVVTEPSSEHAARSRKELRVQSQVRQGASKAASDQVLRRVQMQHAQETAALVRETQAMKNELEGEQQDKDDLRNSMLAQFRAEFEKAVEANRQQFKAMEEAFKARIASLERQVQNQIEEMSAYRAAHSRMIVPSSQIHEPRIVSSGPANKPQAIEIGEISNYRENSKKQEGHRTALTDDAIDGLRQLRKEEVSDNQPSKKQKLENHQSERKFLSLPRKEKAPVQTSPLPSILIRRKRRPSGPPTYQRISPNPRSAIISPQKH